MGAWLRDRRGSLFHRDAVTGGSRAPGGPPHIQIFATDIDASALNTAREGSYPAAIETDVSEERLRRFFILEKDRYRVKRELRDTVLFALHNLTNDPPFSRLDMISCRNVLIYFDRDLQRQACGIFNYALNPGGYLFMGASENADSPRDAFTLIDRDARIYRSAGNLPAASLPPLRAFGMMPLDARQFPVAQSHAAPLGDAASHKLALEELAPPSVLADGSYRVLHVSESAGRYMQLPGGPPTANIADLIRPELRLGLLAALSRAFERQIASVTAPVMVKFNGTEAPVYLQVRPVSRRNTPPSALVFFIEASAEDLRSADFRSLGSAEPGSDSATKALAEELESTRTQLHTSRQEYESVIEELRAANEEMQSVGEEYRSTAEELETSREELQSINEELQATNQELKFKVESVSRAHNDLQNLISVTDVGTLFLDSELHIRRFTPRVADLFNITDSDEGRPISDFTHRLINYPGLGHYARKVLADLSSLECEVQSDAGRWYLVRMRPYRTIEDKIEGVVVTFVDISERRQTEANLLQSERRLQLAREATSLGIVDYDAVTGELWFDARCRELWGLGAGDAVNLDVFFAGIAEKDRPAAHEAFGRALEPADGGLFSVEFRLEANKDQWLRATGKAFFTGGAKSQRASRLVGTIQDITAAKAWEAQQVLLLQELSHRVKNTLTIIMSMARQTLRDDTSPEALEKYEARLRALSDAHDLLVQTGWSGAEIGSLIRRLLAAYAATGQGRVTIDGPDLLLPPYLATPFAMLVHELATNAAKYGALGERGTVSITWRIVLQRDGKLLDLVWRENGGPAVSGKRRPGFGTFLIEEGLPDAKVEQRFEPGGLVCRVELRI